MQWEFIILHHSASPTHLKGRQIDITDIDRWHKEQGWGKVGYHYIIPADGELQIGRGLTEQGVHTRGMNNRAIGICIVGDFTQDKPTDAQYETLAKIIRQLMREFPQLTKDSIKGHRDFNATLCPAGLDFDRIKTMLGQPEFTDITGHWAQSIIREFAERGLIGGYADGTFRPDAPMTRAEVVALLSRFFKAD